jgi:hypothetical protein
MLFTPHDLYNINYNNDIVNIIQKKTLKFCKKSEKNARNLLTKIRKYDIMVLLWRKRQKSGRNILTKK